jgi:hypothetical protein
VQKHWESVGFVWVIFAALPNKPSGGSIFASIIAVCLRIHYGAGKCVMKITSDESFALVLSCF